jgi:hypothetical protein
VGHDAKLKTNLIFLVLFEMSIFIPKYSFKIAISVIIAWCTDIEQKQQNADSLTTVKFGSFEENIFSE